jgi:hypothetical protein
MTGPKLAMIVGGVAVVAAGATAFNASERDDGDAAGHATASQEDARSAPSGSASRARVRGCAGRIEGSVEPPNRDATVIGPVRFADLARSYRYSSRHPRTPLKAVAVVRPGSRVTLVVPDEQRSWLKVGYNSPRGAEAPLQACRHFRSRRAQQRECRWGTQLACRSAPTLFSGGFGVRFDQAPERGRCAELIVRVRGEGRQRREYLFKPRRPCK